MGEIYVNVLTEDVTKAKTLFDRHFNVVSESKDFIDGKPVIILGWQLAKKLYPEASILNYVLDNNVFWTYYPYDNTSAFYRTVSEAVSLSLRL